MSDSPYTNPGFDPASLRVVDLRRVLTDNNVHWTSKNKKSDLVKLFKDVLIPKLRAVQQQQKQNQQKQLEQQQQNKQSPAVHNPKKRRFRDITAESTYDDPDHKQIKRKKLNDTKPLGKVKKLRDTKPVSLVKRETCGTTKSSTNSFQLAQSTPTSNVFDRSLEIKIEPDLPTVIHHNPTDQLLPIANSTFTEDTNDDNTVNDTLSDTQPLTLLAGPQRKINPVEIKKDILSKLEQLNSIKQEINRDIQLIKYHNNQSITENETTAQDQSTIDLSTQTIDNQNSTQNLTFENDTQFLEKLKDEISLENTRIEKESEKVLQIINSRERLKFYKSQYIKIALIWMAILVFSFSVALYRTERIRVGFCGTSTPSTNSSVFNLHLKCVECPDHALCLPNSQLQCSPDYIISKPFFWSFWGLFPTYNKCVLDATKIKKINKIVKTVLNILSSRNASINCGRSGDSDAGLNWSQIKELTDSKLLLDPNDPFYNHYWSKVKLILTTKPEIKFIDQGKPSEILRSTSTKNLSFGCRLKLMAITVLLKYKAYLLSLIFIISFLSYIFHQANQIQKRRQLYKHLERESIKKLQSQKKPVPKIQLRDYFQPQLNKLSRKNRDLVWNKVVQSIEKNSNINVEDKEVNGDIMRVWTWSSPI